MGSATTPHAPGAKPSGPIWPLAAVGVVCLVIGLLVGRTTMQAPAHFQAAPQRPPRSGLAGSSDTIDDPAKKTENTNRTLEAKRAPELDPRRPAATAGTPSNLSGADAQLRSYCDAKWGTDFSMVAYCQQQQREAIEKLRFSGPPDIPADVFVTIRNGCASKWADDFTMRVYCEGEQVKGYRASR